MHHYDDPHYNYQAYWKNRDYEHQSEVLAINYLLSGKYFKKIADVGGGFGRHFPTLSPFSQEVYLIEPSAKLRQIAKKTYIHDQKLHVIHGFSHHLPIKPETFDLVSMIRVSHHLTQLAPTFKEINRVLKPRGHLLLEFANSANFKTQLYHLFSDIPQIPIEKRSLTNIHKQTIAFVNHHPRTILKLLDQSGFIIENTLSVSNFRSPILKKLIPQIILLFLETISQRLLAPVFFGPSILVLAKKA